MSCLMVLSATPASSQSWRHSHHQREFNYHRHQQSLQTDLHDAFATGKATPWSVLGIDRDASERDIKSAYRRMALENHPDKGGSEDQFILVKAAFDTLTDEQLKREYRAQTVELMQQRAQAADRRPSPDLWSSLQGWLPFAVAGAVIVGMTLFGRVPPAEEAAAGTSDPVGVPSAGTTPTKAAWLSAIEADARIHATAAVKLSEARPLLGRTAAAATKQLVVLVIPRSLAESGAAWNVAQQCARSLQSSHIRLAWAVAGDQAAEKLMETAGAAASEEAAVLVYLRQKSAGLFVGSTTLDTRVASGAWLAGGKARDWCERVMDGTVVPTPARG